MVVDGQKATFSDEGRWTCHQPKSSRPRSQDDRHSESRAADDRHAQHLAAELADGHDLPKKQAEAVLGDLVTLTTRHLKKGDKIRLSGLGILQVRKRAARMGRNPATGESIKIKASKKIAFRPAKELRRRCRGGRYDHRSYTIGLVGQPSAGLDHHTIFSLRPRRIWVSTPNQSLGLDDPGVRLRLIHEVGDDPTAPIGLDHLDADAPVLLRDQPVNRINHAEHSSALVVNLYRPLRVPPLVMVATASTTRVRDCRASASPHPIQPACAEMSLEI